MNVYAAPGFNHPFKWSTCRLSELIFVAATWDEGQYNGTSGVTWKRTDKKKYALEGADGDKAKEKRQEQKRVTTSFVLCSKPKSVAPGTRSPFLCSVPENHDDSILWLR